MPMNETQMSLLAEVIADSGIDLLSAGLTDELDSKAFLDPKISMAQYHREHLAEKNRKNPSLPALLSLRRIYMGEGEPYGFYHEGNYLQDEKRTAAVPLNLDKYGPKPTVAEIRSEFNNWVDLFKLFRHEPQTKLLAELDKRTEQECAAAKKAAKEDFQRRYIAFDKVIENYEQALADVHCELKKLKDDQIALLKAREEQKAAFLRLQEVNALLCHKAADSKEAAADVKAAPKSDISTYASGNAKDLTLLDVDWEKTQLKEKQEKYSLLRHKLAMIGSTNYKQTIEGLNRAFADPAFLADFDAKESVFRYIDQTPLLEKAKREFNELAVSLGATEMQSKTFLEAAMQSSLHVDPRSHEEQQPTLEEKVIGPKRLSAATVFSRKTFPLDLTKMKIQIDAKQTTYQALSAQFMVDARKKFGDTVAILSDANTDSFVTARAGHATLEYAYREGASIKASDVLQWHIPHEGKSYVIVGYYQRIAGSDVLKPIEANETGLQSYIRNGSGFVDVTRSSTGKLHVLTDSMVTEQKIQALQASSNPAVRSVGKAIEDANEDGEYFIVTRHFKIIDAPQIDPLAADKNYRELIQQQPKAMKTQTAFLSMTKKELVEKKASRVAAEGKQLQTKVLAASDKSAIAATKAPTVSSQRIGPLPIPKTVSITMAPDWITKGGAQAQPGRLTLVFGKEGTTPDESKFCNEILVRAVDPEDCEPITEADIPIVGLHQRLQVRNEEGTAPYKRVLSGYNDKFSDQELKPSSSILRPYTDELDERALVVKEKTLASDNMPERPAHIRFIHGKNYYWNVTFERQSLIAKFVGESGFRPIMYLSYPDSPNFIARPFTNFVVNWAQNTEVQGLDALERARAANPNMGRLHQPKSAVPSMLPPHVLAGILAAAAGAAAAGTGAGTGATGAVRSNTVGSADMKAAAGTVARTSELLGIGVPRSSKAVHSDTDRPSGLMAAAAGAGAGTGVAKSTNGTVYGARSTGRSADAPSQNMHMNTISSNTQVKQQLPTASLSNCLIVEVSSQVTVLGTNIKTLETSADRAIAQARGMVEKRYERNENLFGKKSHDEKVLQVSNLDEKQHAILWQKLSSAQIAMAKEKLRFVSTAHWDIIIAFYKFFDDQIGKFAEQANRERRIGFKNAFFEKLHEKYATAADDFMRLFEELNSNNFDEQALREVFQKIVIEMWMLSRYSKITIYNGIKALDQRDPEHPEYDASVIKAVLSKQELDLAEFTRQLKERLPNKPQADHKAAAGSQATPAQLLAQHAVYVNRQGAAEAAGVTVNPASLAAKPAR